MLRDWQNFIDDESGPTAVEYAVMLALIVFVCASAVSGIGQATYDSLWMVVESLE